MKRLISLLLAGILIFSLFPAQVLAAEENKEYVVGDTLEVEGTAAPDVDIPEKTMWVQQGDPVKKPSKTPSCGKDEHTHGENAGCDLKCSLEEHTHKWKCPDTCDKEHVHIPECCHDVHEHGTDCMFDHEEHKNHEDSCYTNCPVHTCTEGCQIPEGGTCPNIHSHSEACVPTCEKEIHTHTDECCTAVHVHNETCTPDCGTEEHTHITEGCGLEGQCSKTEHTHGDGSTCLMVCTLEPHAHTNDCYPMVDYTTWELVETVTVSFYTNGICDIADQTVEKGKTATRPSEDPESDDFKFIDWYTGSDYETKYDFSTQLTTDTTIYAKWIPIYTVSFVTNYSGLVIPDQRIAEGDKVTPFSDPEKPNYEFCGWYSDINRKNPWKFEDTITKDTTLYADWKARVTFDSKGGSAVDPQSLLLHSSELIPEPPKEPVKPNYRFAGWWYKVQTQEVQWDFSDPVGSNKALYAKWEKNPLIVSPADKKLYPGETATFTAKFNNTKVDNDNLDWSVSEANSTNTKISSSGVLTIGKKETPKMLTVSATITSGTNEDATDFVYVKVCPIYEFTSGTGGKWSQKSVKSLTFAIDNPYSNEVTKVLIGTKEVKSENYTVTEATDGTTKLTLKADAMKNLSVKEYDLTVLFEDDGKAETTFEVIKESDIPETGDFFHLPLWVCLMAVSAAAVLLLKKRSA